MTGEAIDSGLLDAASGSAAELVGDEAYVAAMVDAERALLGALTLVGAAPTGAADSLSDTPDAADLAAESRGSGNPVIPLVGALRAGASAEARDFVHLGATSQDILDTATMLVAARVVTELGTLLPPVVEGLGALADAHRGTVVVGRTLGQHAAPTTAGLRFAVLLDGVLRSWRRLDSLPLPAQLGGSVGTLAVLTDVLGSERAEQVRDAYAANLGLAYRPTTWHAERSGIADLGSALAMLIGALGRVGLEVSQGTRAEIGELDLAIGEGEGGSSAMPQKKNPVAAVLLVANARRAPGLAATLLGAQLALDERPAGDWHAEWQPLRELLRLAVESADLAGDAVGALTVDVARARDNLALTRGAVHAERAQWALVPFVGRARAAELVREALTAPHFVEALAAATAGEAGGGAEAVARLHAVTEASGPVGLSDTMIDAVLADARSRS